MRVRGEFKWNIAQLKGCSVFVAEESQSKKKWQHQVCFWCWNCKMCVPVPVPVCVWGRERKWKWRRVKEVVKVCPATKIQFPIHWIANNTHTTRRSQPLLSFHFLNLTLLSCQYSVPLVSSIVNWLRHVTHKHTHTHTHTHTLVVGLRQTNFVLSEARQSKAIPTAHTVKLIGETFRYWQ